MIYTVTCNPSLDYILNVENFTVGKLNRVSREVTIPGGKGINVSIVANELGEESTALGFVAGYVGDEILRLMAEQEVNSDFIQLSGGCSRINVKVRSAEETEINGVGPAVSESEIKALYEKLGKLSEGDILVLAGSIPESLPQTLYREILDHMKGRGVRIVVDAGKGLLMNALEYNPFLIKPNVAELEEVFCRSFMDLEELLFYARMLVENGAKNVLLSMGADGAILLCEDGNIYQGEAPGGEAVYTVGAGDSMVAGFLYGYLQTKSFEEAFRWGICAGSASAFIEGFPTKAEVELLLENYQVNIIGQV